MNEIIEPSFKVSKQQSEIPIQINQLVQMINSKQITRKRSENLIQTKQSEPDLKRKKSTSNLLPASKTKKEQKSEQPFKKPKEQKKLVHSTSKGKLNRKHLKSQRNDENFNSLNHKKSVEKIQYNSKTSKDIKTKRVSEDTLPEKKEEKVKHVATEHTLTKASSQAKLNVKKFMKKKSEAKYFDEEKQFEKQKIPSKTLQKNPTSKKFLVTKSKLKHPSSSSIHTQSQSNQRKSTQKRLKLKNKISEIIQKSILYSDVNYDFKEQISLLGSGIKKEQDFFVPYPFHSYQSEYAGNKEAQQRRQIQHNAAVTIQKHFRGYIQRKYIQEARYIIECIKKIQRFWRKCMDKKKQTKRFETTKALETVRGETSTSLITIKDFNDTCRLERRQMLQVEESQERLKNIHHESQMNKDTLKDIIKNLLSQENLDESIKSKIRSAMGHDNVKKEETMEKKLNAKTLTLKPITQLELQSEHTLENSKDFYVKKKINMEINSERCFNSPMNSSTSQFLTSPAVKKLTSPKCLSSSFSKQVKGNYNNYFKSNKNVAFTSPSKNDENTDKKSLRSHSGSKREKENFNQLPNKQSVTKQLNNFPFELQKEFEIRKSTNAKQDYLFNTDICAGSPIAQCKDDSIEEINLLSSQKIVELQTRRTPKPQAIYPFVTEFSLIEEFCLQIADYWLDDRDTRQIFMQKIKGLKYFRIEKIFKEWQKWQFEELSSQNQLFKQSILKSSFQRPTLFSKSQKKLLIQYPSLRLFLNQNHYSDDSIFNQTSAQSAYIKFMFDAFQQCIYQNFKQVTIKDLSTVSFKQARQDIDYLRIVFSQAMSNMLKSAQLLCGSFETDDMIQVQKEQRKIINTMREDEALKVFRDEPFDTHICETWITMLISKIVFDQLVEETAFLLGK